LESIDVSSYECNLAERLYVPASLYEHRIDNHWVIFVPDQAGLPVVIEKWMHNVLYQFREGARVSDIIINLQESKRMPESFDKIFPIIGYFKEKGFLRTKPFTLPYQKSDDYQQRKPIAFAVWLHITNNCNLNCSYCFVKKDIQKATISPEIMQRTASAIAYTAKKHKVKTVHIKFAGGEPTLAMDVMEYFQEQLLRNVENTGIQIQTSILSNGTIITRRLISFLKKHQIGMAISLDGYGDSHDTFRTFGKSGKGSWDIITRNIKKLQEHDIEPFIMSTISTQTCRTLPQLVRWIYENRFKTRLSVVREINCGGNNQYAAIHKFRESCAVLRQEFEKAFRELEDPGFAIDLRVDLDLCELHFDEPAHGICCGVGATYMAIRPDGNMVMCPMLVNEQGTVPTKDLLKTCRNNFPYTPDERSYQRIEEDCLSCRWYPVCAGECPVLNWRVQGHPFTRSPMCEFYQYLIPRYIEFFGKKLMKTAAQGGEHNGSMKI
jgi:uncharacterized protein